MRNIPTSSKQNSLEKTTFTMLCGKIMYRKIQNKNK